MNYRCKLIVMLTLLSGFGCAPTVKPVQSTALHRDIEPEPVLIHCPGIAGEMPIDRRLVRGLIQGGIAKKAEIFDWTGPYRGFLALGKLDHNKQQAKILSDKIAAIYRQDPRTPIILTSHSGGTGIAVWALEQLPADVKVDRLLMLASALSPGYDLKRALSHVGRAVSLYSEYDDVVLGTGTRTFGTIDRVKTRAAGLVGFEGVYANLEQIPYDPAWIKIGNPGDHIGAMDDQFAEQVLSPLLRDNTRAAAGHGSNQ